MQEQIKQKDAILKNEQLKKRIIFHLAPLRSNTWLQQEIIITDESQQLADKNIFRSSVSSIPRYNQDNNPFSPGFSISKQFTEDDQYENQKHFEFKIKSMGQIKNLFEPKPSRNYCGVCHEPYNDYLKHIKHVYHIKKLQQKITDKDIENLSLRLDKLKRIQKKNQYQFNQLGSKKRIIQNNGFIKTKSLKFIEVTMNQMSTQINFDKNNQTFYKNMKTKSQKIVELQNKF